MRLATRNRSSTVSRSTFLKAESIRITGMKAILYSKHVGSDRRSSSPEIRAAHVVVVEQVAGRALEDDAPGLHHVGAVGHPERSVGVLLDHEHGRPAPPDVGDDRERHLDDG